MKNEHSQSERRKLSPMKIASYAGLAVGAIVFVCVLVLLLFPDPLVNRFIKPRITQAFAEAYPEYSIHIKGMHYNVWKNRIGCDSVALTRIDSTFSCSVAAFSVSGIARMDLLRGGSLAPHDFANAAVEAQDIVLDLPQQLYELRCGLLHLSVPDSEMVADSLDLHPLSGDAQFFKASKLRRTRFALVIPKCSVTGLAFPELLAGDTYRARYVQIPDLFLDVLINKDKAFVIDTSSPPMPSEILSSITGTLQIDSLSIMNGRMLYGERYTFDSKTALLTLDSVHMLAEGIANHGDSGAAIVIRAEGMFMNSGAMNVLMSIPVASPQFSYKYSGSMSRMDLTTLNPFLETAEQMRITTGALQTATFEINVASGHASGKVRAVYNDLMVAVVNRQTKSDKGLFDGIASTIANNFKIRGTNVPDKSGSIKTGEVKYVRKPDQLFFEFSWFALRSGVGDVVGF